jgi:hypothetical protein
VGRRDGEAQSRTVLPGPHRIAAIEALKDVRQVSLRIPSPVLRTAIATRPSPDDVCSPQFVALGSEVVLRNEQASSVNDFGPPPATLEKKDSRPTAKVVLAKP